MIGRPGGQFITGTILVIKLMINIFIIDIYPLPSFCKTRYLENSNKKNKDNIKLLLVKKSKKSKTKFANKKLINSKLLSVLIKLTLN